MHARDAILSRDFGDLDSDAEGIEFVQQLLNCNENTRSEILNEQFYNNTNNLDKLLEFLTTNQEVVHHASCDKLILEITLVLATIDLHKTEFTKLQTSEERGQFLLGLLSLNTAERNTLLREQSILSPENIIKMRSMIKHHVLKDEFEQWVTSALNQKKEPKPAAPVMIEKIQVTPVKTETKLPPSDSLVAELNELCEEHLVDPINYESFDNPVITPVGVTHSREIIKKCLTLKKQEPTTRAPLNETDLLPNHAILTLAALLKTDPFDINKLRDFFTCPLSGELFKQPVVAADGNTYEQAYIAAYLAEHNNKLPLTNTVNTRLYPNLFIKNLLVLPRIQDLLTQCLTPLEKKNAALINSFREYQQTRLHEGNYPWFFFRYRRMQKIAIAVDAKKVLQGKMQPRLFFARHDHDLSALSQGRLGKTGNPALAEFEKMQKKSK